ncbi:MAG: hypothetical protein IJH67_08775, partial [Thermoguttaceae bacterium]|nr:hypothetical protein [Thermoguttaceae bacterium]
MIRKQYNRQIPFFSSPARFARWRREKGVDSNIKNYGALSPRWLKTAGYRNATPSGLGGRFTSFFPNALFHVNQSNLYCVRVQHKAFDLLLPKFERHKSPFFP